MVDICAGATFFSCGVVVIVGLFESSGFAGALPPCDGGEMAVCCGGASEDGFCLWSPWSADGTGTVGSGMATAEAAVQTVLLLEPMEN